MQPPLVSIIVPTKNSAATLGACLQSIAAQTYPHIELIVVDNYSTDVTATLAKRFTSHVHLRGPERSAQRNFGVAQATGRYVALIDSDMELGSRVIEACVKAVGQDPELLGLVIPEESFGQGFWAACKRLERSFYVGVPWIEAARFFDRQTYQQAGGYDPTLVSGEDWDLARRIETRGPVGRIGEFIRHNEGRIDLRTTLRKKYYYARHARAYLARNPERSTLTAQVGPLQRYRLFLSHPRQLFRNPVLGLGVLTMKTAEFAAGAMGYWGQRSQS